MVEKSSNSRPIKNRDKEATDFTKDGLIYEKEPDSRYVFPEGDMFSHKNGDLVYCRLCRAWDKKPDDIDTFDFEFMSHNHGQFIC
mgnify:CR=1 FL=1